MFIVDNKMSIFLIIGAIIIELVARHFKEKNKTIILTKYADTENQDNNEFYLQYYQKNQILDFIRVLTTIILISGLFVINTNIWVGFFSVAAGAIVISFRDFILSVIAFFFVTPWFQIGTTVKLGWVQGQIIFIRMLTVGLLGRDIRWENTGELFLVPSHKFMTEIVEKEDLRLDSIIRDSVIIPFSPKNFSDSLEIFMKDLREFLQKNFPVRNANNVWNYPSYTGHKYKIDLRYFEDKYLAIEVRFVGKIRENKKNKELLMKFIDKKMREKPVDRSEE